jgi:hypothetical protein
VDFQSRYTDLLGNYIDEWFTLKVPNGKTVWQIMRDWVAAFSFGELPPGAYWYNDATTIREEESGGWHEDPSGTSYRKSRTAILPTPHGAATTFIRITKLTPCA